MNSVSAWDDSKSCEIANNNAYRIDDENHEKFRNESLNLLTWFISFLSVIEKLSILLEIHFCKTVITFFKILIF